MRALSDRDNDIYRVFDEERLAKLRKKEGRTFPSLEEIMAKYKSVSHDKVMERAKASKNRSGGSTTVALPEGFKDMPFFKPEKDVYMLDVIGYVITDPNHPEGIDPGYIWHSRRYFRHGNIGAEENSYVCLAKTFGKRCPICDYAKLGKNNGTLDKKQLDELRAKERGLFCVIDRDDKEEKIQLWDVSHHHFGKMLAAELPDVDDPQAAKFYEPDSGYSLRVRFAKESFNGRDFWKPERIDFKTRKQDYPDSILEEVPPLDDILIELSYNQLEEIFVMGDSKGDDEPEPRERSRRSRGDDDGDNDRPSRRREPEPEDEPPARRGRRDEPEDEPPARRPSRREEPADEPADEPRRPTRGRRDEPEDEPPARRPSRGGRDTDPEPEPESRRPARGGRREESADEEPPARPRRGRSEEPENEPDDAPPPRRPSRSSSKDDDDAGGKCPQGFVFGDDCEKDNLCDSCKVWGPCNAERRRRG